MLEWDIEIRKNLRTSGYKINQAFRESIGMDVQKTQHEITIEGRETLKQADEHLLPIYIETIGTKVLRNQIDLIHA